MGKEEIHAMYQDLHSKFVELGNFLCPRLVNNERLVKWFEDGGLIM
jgi:hypothetical protein